MVGITCALYDEAFELIKLLTPQKIQSLVHYTGKIGNQDVSLFLTRPAFKKNKNNFLRWLNLYPFSSFIHTGFCGALSANYAVADVCHIGSVSSVSNEHIYSISQMPSIKYHSIATVERPLISMEDREDPRLDKNNLVDMESWYFCNLMAHHNGQNKAQKAATFKIIKIVGDIPGETLLMQNEIKMRAYFSSRQITRKLKIAFLTGPSFFKLYARKRLLQKTLNACILDELSNDTTPDKP